MQEVVQRLVGKLLSAYPVAASIIDVPAFTVPGTKLTKNEAEKGSLDVAKM